MLDIKQMPYHGHNLPASTDISHTPNGPFQALPALGLSGTTWRAPSDNKDLGFVEFEWNGGDPNNGNVTVPHNKFPCYLGLYFVVLTGRKFYTRPA